MGADGTLKFDTSLETGGLQSGMGKIASVAQHGLGVLAGNLMTKATEAVIGLGKEALSSGMNFETSMAKTRTLFSGSEADFAALNDEILRISNSTGLAASGLAEAAYSAESASVPAELLGTMLEQSAHLAAAGFTDIDTALSATAKTMNAYGMEGEDSIGRVQKVLMQTQNLGITTVDELGSSLAQVTPTAAAFGVQFEQVGAALAVMTAQGTPTAQATTQLRSAISELGKDGTKASKALMDAAKGTQYAGMSFTEMMASGADLSDILGIMQVAAEKDGKTMVDMFASVEAGNAALSITKAGETFKKDLDSMATEADVVGEAYGTMSETLEHKTQRIKTSFQNMAISLFQTAAGPLANAAEASAAAIGRLTDAFNEGGMAAVNDTIIDMMDETAAKISDFDWEGAADNIVQKITDFIDGDGMGRFLESAGNLIEGLAKGIGQALPKLLPALARLGGYLVSSLVKFGGQMVSAGWELLKSLAVGLVNALPEIGNAINGVLDTIDSVLGGMAEAVWNWCVQATQKVIEWAAPLASSAGEAASNTLTAVIDWIQQLPGRVWTWLVNTVNRVVQWGQQMVSNASTAASNTLTAVIDWIQQLPGRVWTWLVNTVNRVVQWGQQMVSNASTAAQNMISNVSSTLQQLPGKVWDYLSQAAQKVVQWAGDLAAKGRQAATGLYNAIVDGVRSLPDKMAEIGRSITEGIWNGISGGWSWLTSQVSAKAQSLLEAAKGVLQINSPSKVFARVVGRAIPEGIALGIDQAMPDTLADVKAQARGLVSAAQAEMQISTAGLTQGARHALALGSSGGGTTIYNDNRMEQRNDYHVPVASPSEVAKTQREALRNMVGGVK